MKTLNNYINEALIKKNTNIRIPIDEQIKISFDLKIDREPEFIKGCNKRIEEWCKTDTEKIQGPFIYNPGDESFYDEKKIKELKDNNIKVIYEKPSNYTNYLRNMKGLITNKFDRECEFFYSDKSLVLNYRRFIMFFIKKI